MTKPRTVNMAHIQITIIWDKRDCSPHPWTNFRTVGSLGLRISVSNRVGIMGPPLLIWGRDLHYYLRHGYPSMILPSYICIPEPDGDSLTPLILVVSPLVSLLYFFFGAYCNKLEDPKWTYIKHLKCQHSTYSCKEKTYFIKYNIKTGTLTYLGLYTQTPWKWNG